MNFWTDLIWIGNTLYPRWFVFVVGGVAALLFLAALAYTDYKSRP